MFQRCTGRRPHRSGEWTEGKAIAFIVTLAATGTVTLAAREARMSRKAAYALKRRDPLFASSWEAAKGIARRRAGTPEEGNDRGAAMPSTSSSRSAQPAAPAPGSARHYRLPVGLPPARESGRVSIAASLAGRRPSQ